MGKMFAKKKWLSVLGVISLALGLASFLITRALRSLMIVSFGIIATDSISKSLVNFFVVLGCGLILLRLPSQIKGLLEKRAKEKLTKIGSSYRSKGSSPEDIRRQLEIAKAQRPKVGYHIDRCIAQMDEVSDQLDRFDQLITANEAGSLSEARQGIEETQRTICANLKWVVNSSIAAAEDEGGNLDRFIRNINSAIATNAEVLAKDDEFLIEIADYLSQKSASADGNLQLEAWRKTIDSLSNLNKKSILGDEKK